jgi:hypothetical protein
MSITAEHAGRRILREEADEQVVEKAARLVLDGKAEWVFDPEVPDVVALIRTGTNQAYVVVYLPTWRNENRADFELGEIWDEEEA